MEAVANDENVRPLELNGPSDSDRARFGFRRRTPQKAGSVEASPAKACMQNGPAASIQEATGKVLTPVRSLVMNGSRPDVAPRPCSTAALADAEPVKRLDLVALFDGELGDLDAAQAMLKLKPRAGRYDFKDQIEELRNVIRPLKEALAERLRRQAAARDAIAAHQTTIDGYVASLDMRIAHSDRLINEKLAQERELNSQKVQKLRQQVLETERAWQQKELVQERAVAERDRETEELHRQSLGRVQGELQDSKDETERRLREASQLLESQIGQSRRLTQEMHEAAEQKEKALSAEWAGKLEEAQRQAQEHDAKLRADAEAHLAELTSREAGLREAAAAEAAERQRAAAEELAAAREARTAEVEALTKANAEALEGVQSASAEKEALLQSRQAEEVAGLHTELEQSRELRARQLAEREAVHVQELQQASEKHTKCEAELRAELARGTEAAAARERHLRETAEAAEQQAQASHAARVQQLQADHAAREQQLKAEHAAREAEVAASRQCAEASLRAREAEQAAAMQRAQAEGAARTAELELRAQQRERELTQEAAVRLEAATSAAQQREQELLARLERQTAQAHEATTDWQIQSEASASAAGRREEELRSQLKAATFRTKQLADDLAASRGRADAQEELFQQEILEAGQRIRKMEGELATERSTRDRECIAKASLQGEHTALVATAAEQRARLQELQSQLASSQERAAELQQELRGAEAEGERLREAVAEEQARLQKQQEELDTTAAKASELRAGLAAANAELATLRDRSRRLSSCRRELELEFSSYREHNSTSNAAQMQAITELKVTVDKLTHKVDAAQMELGVKSGDIEQHQRCIRRLEDQLSQAETSRRELHNTIQELRGNIRVFCRVRPGPPELESSLQQTEEGKLAVSHGGESYNFSFDKVFGPQAAQEDLFSEVSGLVQSALDGYKVCIFAYGQTGSGKTFTMQGNTEPSTWGMIPRSLRQIFKASEEMRCKGWQWTLKASFMEVYNEVIRDLLRDEPASKTSTTPQCHTIKHDADWGTIVTNMTCVQVASLEHIHALTARAAKLRAVGATDQNSVSSRSHSVFALYLSGSNQELNSELRGALHLVDLAGSERLSKSHAAGDRLKETQNINRSLSSLTDVFCAKAEGRSHVPFRNSKLTHLMEPCLSGQGKTLMAVTVGPEQLNSHETLCSLRFASQVSNCNTGGKPKRSQKTLSKNASVAAMSITPGMRRGGC